MADSCPLDTRTGFQGLLVTCSAPRISVNTARRYGVTGRLSQFQGSGSPVEDQTQCHLRADRSRSSPGFWRLPEWFREAHTCQGGLPIRGTIRGNIDPSQEIQSGGGALARYLRELGTPLLAIPIPDAGKGHASFLQKDVAVRIQLPSPEMLREAAQRRIVAARKKQWQSTGKPGKPPWVNPCDGYARIASCRE